MSSRSTIPCKAVMQYFCQSKRTILIPYDATQVVMFGGTPLLPHCYFSNVYDKFTFLFSVDK
jgi:hypothetical protein